MAVVVVGRIRVTDRAAWEDYRGRVGGTIARFGGEVLFRGRFARALSGDAQDLIVAIRFADEAAAVRWHDSPDYQSLVPLRDRGADVTLSIYQE